MMKRFASIFLPFLLCLIFFIAGNPTYAKEGWVNIYGTVKYNGSPVCAMVLANGQYKFTCSGDGSFKLDVPLDENGQITVSLFVVDLLHLSSRFSPIKGKTC